MSSVQWTPWLDDMDRIVESLYKVTEELEEDPNSSSAIETTKIELHSAKGLLDSVGLKTSTQTIYEIEEMVHRSDAGFSPDLVSILEKARQKLSELSEQIRVNKPKPDEINELDKAIGLESILVKFGVDYKIEVDIKAEKSLRSARALSVFNAVKRIAVINKSSPSEEDLFLDAKFDVFILEITSRESPDEIQEKISKVPSVQTVQIEKLKEEKGGVEGALSSDISIRVNLSNIRAIENGLTVLSTHVEAIKSEIASTKGLQELSGINKSFEMIQSDIRKMRKVPLDSITAAFPSMIKRLAKQEGKNAELIVQGRFITLDRALANYLVDPLTQILRNAVSHGIEDPKTRRKNKKSPIGQIVINAHTERDKIIIQIRDDGHGIDTAKLKEVAKEQGIKIDKNSNQDELSQLIFAKGLSSKEAGSSVSGRGLGLYSAMERVSEIGGKLAVNTEEGNGTTFTFEFSDTDALSKSLIFSVDQAPYGIPSDDIEFVQVINTSELKNIENSSAMLTFRDQQLPVGILHTIIGEMSPDQIGSNASKILLVCRGSNSLIGLLVDEIIDERLVNIKPLNPLLQSFNLFNGTITGKDREVILVLDPAAIM